MTQVLLTGVLLLAGGYTPRFIVPKLPHVTYKRIVGGTYDPGDPAVIELFGISGYDPSECNGDRTCLQGCENASGQSCSSGTGCVCGAGFTCTSELIGPHTLLTAGHCTDLTPGGEISGTGGPAMVVCTDINDANNVLGGTPTSTCNLVMFAIFNNTCETNDENSDCEFGLINGVDGGPGGNFILIDQMVNPGYDPNVNPPGNDNDVGLCHLSQTTLENGGAEPALLEFNRTDEGNACSSLGSLKFVGYGITSGSGQIAGVKMTVNHTADVLDDYHNFEGADPYGSCTAGNAEPTCSGDSGGPSLNSAGQIMGTVSLGDGSCTSWGQDCRADAQATFYDCQMQCWTDPINGGAAAPDCSSYSCVYAPVQSSSSSSSSGGSSSGGSSGSGSGSGTSSSSSSSGSGTSSSSSSGSASSSSSSSSSSGSASSSSSGSGSSGSGGSSSSGESSSSSRGSGGYNSSSSSAPASGSSSGLVGPPPHAVTPTSSGGCATGPGAAGDAPAFGALAFLGLVLLRRRGRSVDLAV